MHAQFNLHLEIRQPKCEESSSVSYILQSFHQRNSAACLSWAHFPGEKEKQAEMPCMRVCVRVCARVHVEGACAHVRACVQVAGSMLGRTENLSKEDIPKRRCSQAILESKRNDREGVLAVGELYSLLFWGGALTI